MPYTPVELRHVRLARGLVGYRRSAVDELLLDVADSFAEVWRDRGELEDKVERLEQETAELRLREELLANALVAAERAATEVREHAKRDAELIVAEAHQEARSIVRGAQGEHARLSAETRRVEALLRAALGMVDEAGGGISPESEAKAEPWPRREDTREFPRSVRPLPETEPEREGHDEPEARAG
jgi:cell division initiation protein